MKWSLSAMVRLIVLDGRNAYLTNGMERALGRPPRDFAREAAATGVWNRSPDTAAG
jgi:hypothetical protein